SRAGNGADRARLDIHTTDQVVLHFDEQQVAHFVEADFIWLIELGLRRRAAVARVPLRAAASDRRQLAAFQVQLTDAVIANLADIKRSIRPDLDAERIADVGFERRAGVAAILRL